jgi:hypothetical protein
MPLGTPQFGPLPGAQAVPPPPPVLPRTNGSGVNMSVLMQNFTQELMTLQPVVQVAVAGQMQYVST